MAALLVAQACSFDWAAYEPRAASTAPAGGSAGAGATDAGGTGGVATGGTAGAGGVLGGGGAGGDAGTGGSGGIAGGLVDRGLMVRYYIDEADSGTAPAELADAASDPLALALDYGGVGGGTNMSFSEVAGNRGLAWTYKSWNGAAAVSLSGTKLTALDGETRATIECVADIESAGGANICGRILHYGVNDWGTFTLCAGSADFSFHLNGGPIEEWGASHASQGRLVMHLVMDTSLASGDDRARFFLDGADQGIGSSADAPPAINTPINYTYGTFGIGNRAALNGSIEGTIYYCAVYAAALSPLEIAHNQAILAADDDHP